MMDEAAGFGEKQKSASVPEKAVENSAQGGTIIPSEQNGADAVREVCKLNIEKYRCVSPNIATDEVIITDERVAHIQARHPEDYERFCSYIPKIIADPDYIIAANKENTAVILKEIIENGEKFKLILRLKIQSDPETYKNSIISFWKIGGTTWKKTIKNKIILYKSE